MVCGVPDPAAGAITMLARLAFRRPALVALRRNRRSHQLSTSAAVGDELDFQNPELLTDHFRKTMQFHLKCDFDTTHGGYFQQISREGVVCDATSRHLYNTTRGAYTYALAAKTFGDSADLDDQELAQDCVQGSKHGVRFLQDVHQQPDGSYAANMICENGATSIDDATKLCYGHAFVLLALSGAHMVGAATREDVEGIWELLERRFYRAEDELYVDEIAAACWDDVSPYRGQNANMHMTEAMLCAYEATADPKYLDRATSLSRRICLGLAEQSGGAANGIWEHFSEDWTIDYDYNLDDKQHLIRPWGFLPGHSAEWAKLLCILYRLHGGGAGQDHPDRIITPSHRAWIIPTAEALFAHAVRCWDTGKRAAVVP